jgi:pyrimidine-specific ribonucleoside hydrolase
MMIRRSILILMLSALVCGTAFSHSGKPKYHVVIDTDGAIDDMRALSMLLSGNDIRVLAITCSQGTLAPERVFEKVSALLAAFHHEGIPLGMGEGLLRDLPPWSPFAQGIEWAAKEHTPPPASSGKSADMLSRVLKSYPNKVTLVALGSLKTYADWIRTHGNEADRIERIIWYNNHHIEDGFNYQVSPESFDYIRQSGIRLDIVANTSDKFAVDGDYLDHVRSAQSIYSDRIDQVHARPSVADRISDRHLQLWDDMVPLYLTVPLLFETDSMSAEQDPQLNEGKSQSQLRLVAIHPQLPPDFIYEAIGKLLGSATTTNNRVFKAFPTDTTLYKQSYASMLNETIRKYGLIEWKAISMTNEIHGHTGIYSIIGAKMGIRAMEYFNVGVNNLEALTFAGHNPPLSCFNDGVQISTGATIGQGLISISDSISPIPSAIFEFNDQQVLMALDPEIAEQIQKEIRYGVTNYGLLSNTYWLYIENLAIEYWADFDRQEIFVIQKIMP